MSIETKPAHVSETELAERLSEVLDRVAKGERITVQRDGREIAVITPPKVAIVAPSQQKEAASTHEPAFDEEALRHMKEFRDSLNVVRIPEWPG